MCFHFYGMSEIFHAKYVFFVHMDFLLRIGEAYAENSTRAENAMSSTPVDSLNCQGVNTICRKTSLFILKEVRYFNP